MDPITSAVQQGNFGALADHLELTELSVSLQTVFDSSNTLQA